MNYELPEIHAVGTFHSDMYFRDISVTKPRIVQNYELEYFFEDGGVSVVNGIEYPIKKGNVLFAKPGDTRYSHLPANCRFILFSVKDEQLKNAINDIKNLTYIVDCKNIENHFNSILSGFNSIRTIDNISAASQCVMLLSLFSRDGTTQPKIITRAQRFIEANFNEDISNKDISSACYVNVSYLYKMFKTFLNLTPGEYLLNCRLTAARNLLMNTDLPLVDVAYRCGFNSQSYFTYIFKQSVGVSPGKFRKNYLKQDDQKPLF